jgi:hypothetical protein
MQHIGLMRAIRKHIQHIAADVSSNYAMPSISSYCVTQREKASPMRTSGTPDSATPND